MKLKFALLGAGRIGKVHAHAIAANPDAELVSVVDALPAAAAAIVEQYGCATSSIDKVEADANVGAVVICTPTDTHADLIERFAGAGKAVFCEKPIDLDTGRVDRCLQIVAKTGVQLMVGFNRRFDPHFMALSETVRQGRIGAVEQVVITSRDPGPPPLDCIKRSGGIFRDTTIHDFDMARFLLGAEPVSVTAAASVLIDEKIGKAGDFDTAVTTLVTANGRQCLIANSRRATYGYASRSTAQRGW